MKKLIAALVLATSFAALADDAAKKDPAKTEKKSTEKNAITHGIHACSNVTTRKCR